MESERLSSRLEARPFYDRKGGVETHIMNWRSLALLLSLCRRSGGGFVLGFGGSAISLLVRGDLLLSSLWIYE
jgi:hypothetical protein